MSYYLNSAISFKLQNFKNQKKTPIKMIKPIYLSLDTKMYIKLAHKSMKIIREKKQVSKYRIYISNKHETKKNGMGDFYKVNKLNTKIYNIHCKYKNMYIITISIHIQCYIFLLLMLDVRFWISNSMSML